MVCVNEIIFFSKFISFQTVFWDEFIAMMTKSNLSVSILSDPKQVWADVPLLILRGGNSDHTS